MVSSIEGYGFVLDVNKHQMNNIHTIFNIPYKFSIKCYRNGVVKLYSKKGDYFIKLIYVDDLKYKSRLYKITKIIDFLSIENKNNISTLDIRYRFKTSTLELLDSTFFVKYKMNLILDPNNQIKHLETLLFDVIMDNSFTEIEYPF